MTDNINELIRYHKSDVEQCTVLESSNKKLMVEAPAGYGKTKTLINKTKIMLFNDTLPNNKKILCLTYGVNAAYKIEKEIYESFKSSSLNVKKRIKVSNFHRLAFSILIKYGYLIDDKLKTFKKLEVLDEADKKVKEKLNKEDQKVIKKLSFSVENAMNHHDFYASMILSYNKVIKDKLITYEILTYNSIMTLAIELLKENREVREFYQTYYPVIIIDEFQDTNQLGLQFIEEIITKESSLIFFGDSLQRIFGFIGSIPHLIDKTVEKYNMEYVQLKTNYRFSENENLLRLEKNIRENALNPYNPNIREVAKVNFNYLDNQRKEALYILENICELIESSPNISIAILVKQRGGNINEIIELLESHGINIFNALFTKGVDYNKFHSICLSIYMEEFDGDDLLKTHIKNFCQKVNMEYDGEYKETFIELLEYALKSIVSERRGQYKREIILALFNNKELSNYLDQISSHVTVSTVFNAKGLEWDYVILPDMEQELFPNYMGLCNKGQCEFSSSCNFVVQESNKDSFLDELNIFYVAITRARKDVFLTASKEQIHFQSVRKVNLSCMLSLPGITIE